MFVSQDVREKYKAEYNERLAKYKKAKAKKELSQKKFYATYGAFPSQEKLDATERDAELMAQELVHSIMEHSPKKIKNLGLMVRLWTRVLKEWKYED